MSNHDDVGTGQRPRGHFITLEGIDGAGKSTHVTALQSWLQSRDIEVLCTREPGGTALAESLRALVLHQPMDVLTEALLMFAARRDHLQTVIEPALARGVTVLCDRFSDASFAYQGAGRGLNVDVLTMLEQWVQDDRHPDLTLWFDAPAALAAARRAAAREGDRFERQDEAFFTRVRAGYLARQQGAPLRFVQLDASGSVEHVWQQLEAALQRYPWGRMP